MKSVGYSRILYNLQFLFISSSHNISRKAWDAQTTTSAKRYRQWETLGQHRECVELLPKYGSV